jgi:hypothetical protein
MSETVVVEAPSTLVAYKRTTLWSQWVLANALAELLGLGTSALLWLGLIFNVEQRLGVMSAAAIVVVGSTLLEGSAVGIGQWLVLRRIWPTLKWQQWWLGTAIGAFIAWTLGMIPSTLMSLAEETTTTTPAPEISDIVVWSLAALMGLVLGPILALPQWFILRRHVAHAGWWIPGNAAAWGLGMPVIFMGMGLIPEGAVTLTTLVIVLLSLALAGAVVGMVHGTVLLWLLHRNKVNSGLESRL